MMDEQHDIKALAGMDGSPVGVHVGGRFFKAGQLSQADYVEVWSELADAKVEKIFAAAPQNFRPDTIELKAKTIQLLMDSPAIALNMLGDGKCLTPLAYRCVKAGGDWPVSGNFLGFVMKLDNRGYQELQEMVWKCSGFTVTKKSDAEDANATANP